jgi:prepilin-type N-terminal cleavage/methylation domain-containing protein
MRRRGQAGFTLTELMIGVAVMAVVSISLGGTFEVGYQTLSQEGRKIAADRTVSATTLVLTRDISGSSLTGTWWGGSPANPLLPGNGAFIALVYGPGGGTTVVTYSIDASGTLLRSLNFAAGTVVARDLASLSIAQTGCLWSVSVLASASGASQRTFQVAQRNQGCI